MADQSGGEGWWLASDGKWYPPQSSAVADAPTGTAMSPQARWLWLGGAVAVVVGAMLPWASVATPFGTISKNGTDGDGIITMIFGLAAGVLLLLRWNRAPARGLTIAALVVSVLIGVVAVVDMIDVKSRFTSGSVSLSASIGVGLWLTLLGAVAALAGTIISLASRRSRAATAPLGPAPDPAPPTA